MGFFNCIFQVVLVMLVLNANAIKAEVIVRNAPGRSAAETLQLFHRALGEAEIWKREDDFKGSIPFNASVKDMMLFTLYVFFLRRNWIGTQFLTFPQRRLGG